MIIITGGAGFIGSNIAKTLIKNGKKDLIISDYKEINNNFISSDELMNIRAISPDSLFRYIVSSKKNIESIIHMGAVTDTTEKNINKVLDNNFYFSMQLFDFCAENNIKLIYASSASTYGDGNMGFDDKSDSKYLSGLQPLNAYGWSKHFFDRRIIRLFEERKKFLKNWAGLKFFNVYGPNESHKKKQSSVVFQMFESISHGKPITLFKSDNPEYEDGMQKRDFVFVDDCVSVVAWLLGKDEFGGIFNVGTGKARSFLDIAKVVSKVMKVRLNINWIDTPENLKKHYQYFTEAKLSNLRSIGYNNSFFTIEDGIKKYIEGYLL